MPSVKDLLSASALALFVTTNAHMILLTPPPYGDPDSSPLDPSGSNFPCKATAAAGGTITEMPIGATQQLSFKGSAVHGGGSCQVSLTTDNPATKSSKWQVIHSIEGGCPSKTATGNLGDAPDATDLADKYQYSIPAGVKPGTYTLAWTWFNHIGNREMYMNCATVKVTGGSTSKRDAYTNETYAIPDLSERDASFPDMFVANIPTTNCVSVDSMDVKFPNPGSSVDQFGDKTKLAPPTGPKCDAGPAGVPSTGATSASGGGAGSASAGAASGSSGASTSGTGTAGATDSGSPGTGTQASTAGSSSPAGADSMANANSGPAAAASSSSPSSAPSAGSNSSTGSSSSASSAPPAPPAPVAPTDPDSTSTTCTSPGQVICSPDSKQIGECDQSLKVMMTPVPQGTICRGGAISWPQKRSRIFANGYIRRDIGLGRWGF